MAVREGLLALLADGERHGYQLKTSFETATGGVWSLNVGQVYTTLDRLVRDGYVTVEETEDDGGPQKIYELTAAGREELTSWWDIVPGDDPPPREELLLKVLLAVTSGPEHALEVVTRNRSALTALLQRRRRGIRGRQPADDPATELATRMLEDALITRTEADLRWLDQCESRILAERTRATGASTGARQ